MSRVNELLKLPARSAARILSLWQINDVEVAMTRLQLQANHAGLTQHYNALRRLQDGLRASAPQLNGSISKKHMRGLAEVVRTAREPVNAAALLEFFERLPLNLEERDGAQSCIDSVKADYAEAVDQTSKIETRFAELTSRWRKTLRSYKVRIDPEEPPTFETFDAVALRAVGDAELKLRKALDQIVNVDDQKAIVKARRAAERLFNIMEIVRDSAAAFADSARGLSQLENLLADISTANAARAVAVDQQQAARVLEIIDQMRVRLFVDLERMWLLDNNKWFFQRLFKAREITFPLVTGRAGYPRDPARAASPLRAPSAV